MVLRVLLFVVFFFFNDTATTEIYTLSLHDALPICASLAGPTDVGELGLSACSGVTKDEINKVAKLKMVSKLVVRGGTIKTRAKLINARDKDSIENFLQEGKTDPSPIIHKFIPIWDILQARCVKRHLKPLHAITIQLDI